QAEAPLKQSRDVPLRWTGVLCLIAGFGLGMYELTLRRQIVNAVLEIRPTSRRCTLCSRPLWFVKCPIPSSRASPTTQALAMAPHCFHRIARVFYRVGSAARVCCQALVTGSSLLCGSKARATSEI